MKVFGFLLLTCVLAAGCDEETVPSPSSPNTINFTSTLLTSNETPAVTNAEQTGRGTSLITLNVMSEVPRPVCSAFADEPGFKVSGVDVKLIVFGLDGAGAISSSQPAASTHVSSGIQRPSLVASGRSGKETRSRARVDAQATCPAERLENSWESIELKRGVLRRG